MMDVFDCGVSRRLRNANMVGVCKMKTDGRRTQANLELIRFVHGRIHR